MSKTFIKFVKDVYGTNAFVPLHEPTFNDDEKVQVMEALESTFVSSIGKSIENFESKIKKFTRSTGAIATVNGTAALHTSLFLSGVQNGDLVITQAISFIAACNAISYLGASPIFVDVERESLGLCPDVACEWLEKNAYIDDKGMCRHRSSKAPIKAILVVHTFGHPARLKEILKICKKWRLTLIEDAAESLGSLYQDKHTGTFGRFGCLSFNGNKIITTGGGGMILSKLKYDEMKAKHITTTAKVSHPFELMHDEVAFNYRLPNLNAALGCAQMKSLKTFIQRKRKLALEYQKFFKNSDFEFIIEPSYGKSNYWLNAIICPDKTSRDRMLKETKKANIATRPIWMPIHKLPMFKSSLRSNLPVTEFLGERIVNIPSSPLKL